MNPLKQRAPAGEPGLNGKIAMADELFSQTGGIFQVHCGHCAFFEIVEGGKRRRGLCHFTGLHNPQPEQDGCQFIYGRWEDIDSILGLTQGNSKTTLETPNYERPRSGLARTHGQKVAIDSTAIHAYADKDGNKALHIGRAQRPHVREAAAASHRPGSVDALPFCFNHPEL